MAPDVPAPDAPVDPPPQDEEHDRLARATAGRARAEDELRVAAAVGIVALLVGQGLLLAGAGPLALVLVAIPGTVAGIILARRWSRLAAGDLEP